MRKSTVILAGLVSAVVASAFIGGRQSNRFFGAAGTEAAGIPDPDTLPGKCTFDGVTIAPITSQREDSERILTIVNSLNLWKFAIKMTKPHREIRYIVESRGPGNAVRPLLEMIATASDSPQSPPQTSSFMLVIAPLNKDLTPSQKLLQQCDKIKVALIGPHFEAFSGAVSVVTDNPFKGKKLYGAASGGPGDFPLLAGGTPPMTYSPLTDQRLYLRVEVTPRNGRPSSADAALTRGVK